MVRRFIACPSSTLHGIPGCPTRVRRTWGTIGYRDPCRGSCGRCVWRESRRQGVDAMSCRKSPRMPRISVGAQPMRATNTAGQQQGTLSRDAPHWSACSMVTRGRGPLVRRLLAYRFPLLLHHCSINGEDCQGVLTYCGEYGIMVVEPAAAWMDTRAKRSCGNHGAGIKPGQGILIYNRPRGQGVV